MQATGHDDAQVFGKRYGGFDALKASADDLGAAAVVGMEERLETRLASALDLSQRRPASQEVAKEDRVRILEPVESLRIVLLEGVGQAVGQPGCCR